MRVIMIGDDDKLSKFETYVFLTSSFNTDDRDHSTAVNIDKTHDKLNQQIIKYSNQGYKPYGKLEVNKIEVGGQMVYMCTQLMVKVSNSDSL